MPAYFATGSACRQDLIIRLKIISISPGALIYSKHRWQWLMLHKSEYFESLNIQKLCLDLQIMSYIYNTDM